MGKVKIVISDLDEKYLIPLERGFLELYDEEMELMIITDAEYLEHYFHTPQNIDILIINEGLYYKEMEKHNLKKVFFLSERNNEDNQLGDNFHYVYKYTSVKEIINEITTNLPVQEMSNYKKERLSEMILVYSPIGGIGKTTFSMGLAGGLTKNFKKVLFVGMDSLQSFGNYMKTKTTLKSGIEKQLAEESQHIYEVVKPQIVSEYFSFLPPLPRSLASLNIEAKNFINLLERIKESKEYDYIVIDGPNDFSQDLSKLMQSSEQTVLLTGQKKSEADRMNYLFYNIDCSDRSKFTMVCNKFNSENPNVYLTEEYIQQGRIDYYIEENNNLDGMSCEEMGNLKCFHNIALKFI